VEPVAAIAAVAIAAGASPGVVTEPAVTTNYEALASAMSRAVATLSREIAAAIPRSTKGKCR